MRGHPHTQRPRPPITDTQEFGAGLDPHPFAGWVSEFVG
jgi:hypothetical protein